MKIQCTIIATLAALLLSGCGSDIKGQYCTDQGLIEIKYDFDGRGEVTVDGGFAATSSPYEVKGRKVLVGPKNGQRQSLTIIDSKTLDAGMFELTKC